MGPKCRPQRIGEHGKWELHQEDWRRCIHGSTTWPKPTHGIASKHLGSLALRRSNALRRDGDRRDEIEARRRPNSVPLTDEKLGRAVIRDQNPLIESKLIKTLKGCTAEEWYRLLDGRVFFWLTVERLNKLLCAKAYRGSEHTVLTVDTRSLVSAYKAAVTLTPMNTGNTQPFAHPRGPDKSMKLQDYPFDERAKYGRQYQVVEIAIEHGVTDIKKYVISAETLKCAD